MKKTLLWILDLAINIAVIFGLVLIIQTWIIAPFDIYGPSMCDTLNFIDDECETQYGEKIMLNEAGYMVGDPERGDIVVFKAQPDSDKYFIKRIIGLPGETIEIKNGNVFLINSKDSIELEENYLNETNKGKTETFFNDLTIFEIPEEHYMLMGDNRKASTDSRTCFKGKISSECASNPEQAFVHRDLIRGKAWFIWWPLANMRFVESPEYFQANSES